MLRPWAAASWRRPAALRQAAGKAGSVARGWSRARRRRERCRSVLAAGWRACSSVPGRAWSGLLSAGRAGSGVAGFPGSGRLAGALPGDVGEHARPGGGVLGGGLGAAGQAGGGADEGVERLPEFRGAVLFGGEVAGQGAAACTQAVNRPATSCGSPASASSQLGATAL